MLLGFYLIVSSTIYMYSNGVMVMESMWTVPWNPCGLFHGIHVDCSMESKVDMPKFHVEFVESMWNPYGINHSMCIP
jgi:hypothetical protein